METKSLASRIAASEVFGHVELPAPGQEVKQETRGFDKDSGNIPTSKQGRRSGLQVHAGSQPPTTFDGGSLLPLNPPVVLR